MNTYIYRGPVHDLEDRLVGHLSLTVNTDSLDNACEVFNDCLRSADLQIKNLDEVQKIPDYHVAVHWESLDYE